MEGLCEGTHRLKTQPSALADNPAEDPASPFLGHEVAGPCKIALQTLPG